MLAPHELKSTKPFQKAVRGYNQAEVDEYIDFLLEKYTEAYKENNALDKKLRVVAAKLEDIKDEEEAIRTALLNAQKAGEKIISDAHERSDVIVGAIKERCDAIITDFKKQIEAEKEEMWEIRTRVLEFKKTVFEYYKAHILELQELSVNELSDILLPDENKLADGIKSEVAKIVAQDIKRKEQSEKEKAEAKPLIDEAEKKNTDGDSDMAEFAKKFEE